MADTISCKRLVLRAVLRQVSPMVIRLISVSDQLQLPAFHDVFRAILGWDGDLGYIIRIHGQEFNSFRRKTRSKALHEFKLHRQEKFLYICDMLHMWEWDVRVVDIQAADEGDELPNLYTSKDSGSTVVSTVFGRVEVANPRWNRCPCQTDGPNTFRPMRTWLNGQTSPEMLYLETKWASLIPFARVADLLKEVLPVGDSLNQETVRAHLYATAERIEQELGEERQLNLFEGSEEDWEQQPLPDGPITIGIDGGYVRAAHKQGWFEVIAGRSVVAFRRDDESEVSSAKCFGYVQTYDEKPRRRLWELMKSQGMQENQQIVFMSDGGENVRRVQEYLHPFSEHLIDWFHITMRITVLQQQTKALQDEQPQTGADVSKHLESIKHLLWHGNAEEAVERLRDLLIELSLIQARSAAVKKVADNVTEFETYIRNNRKFIPNFGERRRQGETISTAFVESTINQVVSRRFVKKQQMQWTLRGAHLLLQTRTKVLNDELDEAFRRWYPKFRPQPQMQESVQKAA